MEENFDILHANNGKEAVNFFTKNKVDLVIMDLRMPEMNGFEASVEIRKIDEKIPIIAHTAFSKESQLLKTKQAGINDILVKPAKLEDVLMMVEKYCGK